MVGGEIISPALETWMLHLVGILTHAKTNQPVFRSSFRAPYFIEQKPRLPIMGGY